MFSFSYNHTPLPNPDLLSRVYHISQRKNILIYENLTVLLRTEPRSAKSPMRDTLTVQTWDLKFPCLIRVLVTDPGRQLPCHLSKAVLRTPGLGRTAFLFYRAEQFTLFPLFEHDWHVHQREHRHEQHGEADPVVADMVAEPRERIASGAYIRNMKFVSSIRLTQ